MQANQTLTSEQSATLERLGTRMPDARVVVVDHGDPVVRLARADRRLDVRVAADGTAQPVAYCER